jgi:hypothetical protein
MCNSMHNRTKFELEGKTPTELLEQQKKLILEKRREFRDFWEENVRISREELG